MSMGIQVSPWKDLEVIGYIARNGKSGSDGTSIFNFFEDSPY